MTAAVREAEASVAAADAALAAAKAEVARLEAVSRAAYAALREARIAADARLPRVRVVSGYRSERSFEVAVTRRTTSSLFVRAPGEESERRFVKPRVDGGDWYEHGNRSWRSYGDEPRIPAADIAALGGGA